MFKKNFRLIIILFFIIILRETISSKSIEEEIISYSFSENQLKTILEKSLSFHFSEEDVPQVHKKDIPKLKQEIRKKSRVIRVSQLPDKKVEQQKEEKKQPEYKPLKPIKGLSFKILKRINRYRHAISKYSKQYNLDEDFVRAVIYAESAGNPKAISKKGAMGLMQLMPRTAANLGIKRPMIPAENIRGGTKLLSMLMKYYQDDDFYVLWAYNAGLTRVNKGFMPNETKNYIIKIKKIQNLLKLQGGKKNA